VESLGNLLTTAREDKGYSLDYVSKETNISVRYISALESEDYTCFPGEPYILGFIKIYGAFLDLNTAELLQLYRAQKIQEQPVPMEQLLKGPSQLPKIIGTILVVLVVLGLAGGGAYFLLINRDNTHVEMPEVHVPTEYPLSADTLERRFYLGDTILVSIKENDYIFRLASIGETVTITTPVDTKILDLGQDATIDLTNRGSPDLKITLSDYAKNDPNVGAQIRFELLTNNEIAAVPEPAVSETAARPTSLQGAQVIFSSNSAYPFRLQASFQGFCFFRWEILNERDRQGRNEQYFSRSDERIIEAQNGIRLGVSNAQAVKLQVIAGGRTVPLDLGGAGEIVVAELRWLRDEDNRYRLVLRRLE